MSKKEYSSKISPSRFVLLCLVTFTIYELYWFYKQWKLIKEKQKLSPFWRAFFSIFYVDSLFKRLNKLAQGKGYKRNLHTGWLAGIWIIGSYVMWRLPDPYWLVSYLTFLPILPVVTAMNHYYEKTEGKLPMKKLSWWQMILIIIGLLILLLAIYETFIPG
jgi:hypothetical protein